MDLNETWHAVDTVFRECVLRWANANIGGDRLRTLRVASASDLHVMGTNDVRVAGIMDGCCTDYLLWRGKARVSIELGTEPTTLTAAKTGV